MPLRNNSFYEKSVVLPASVEERSISSPLSFLFLPCSEPRLCWPGPVEAIPPRLGKRFGSTQRAVGGGRRRGSEPLWKNQSNSTFIVTFSYENLLLENSIPLSNHLLPKVQVTPKKMEHECRNHFFWYIYHGFEQCTLVKVLKPPIKKPLFWF